jgi:23S rRNA-/tRNA-specific pseudouridylate synthase
VLERAGERTLVELEPVTGRTNQLRIHCAHAGHPIVGDEWYGAGAADGAGRLCLHAARLAFFHPSGGNRWMEFTSPAPF